MEPSLYCAKESWPAKATFPRKRLWRAVCWIWLCIALGLVARVVRAQEPVRLHEVHLVYRIDRSRVPSWVTSREVTLIVQVGPAFDVVALGDGALIPCTYDGERALITTAAERVEVVVTGPTRPAEEIGRVSVATLREDKRWALSLTLDDGYLSQTTIAKALLDRYGYKASIAVIGARIGQVKDGKIYASAAELRKVVADGWHLSNHTYTHQYAAEIGGEAAVVNNLRAANEAIMAAVPGYVPIMFTSPYVDPDFIPILQARGGELGIRLAQTGGWEGREVDPGVFRVVEGVPYNIGRTQLLQDGSQFDMAHQWVEANPGKHLWLSLHTHDVVEACDCVETAPDILYRTYGAGGTDEVWVAPAPEVFQYLVVRDSVSITEIGRALVGRPPAGLTPPTPTPTPTPRTVVLQRGLGGYTAVQDTYLDALNPNSNYRLAPDLKVRTLDGISSLIRFDMRDVPTRAIILGATLQFYGLAESNANTMCLAAYPLLRPWDEARANWLQAGAADPWGAAGAGAVGIDRAAEHSGLRGLVQGIDRWYRLEIPQAVQAWVAHPERNHGLLLAGAGGTSKALSLASSDYGNPSLRPKLIITYTLPLTEAEPLPPGDALLAGRVLLEGRPNPPAPAWSSPITLTLARPEDGAAVWTRRLTTGAQGEFVLEGLAPGVYDLTVVGPNTLPCVRRGVQLRSGLNILTLGPLPAGDVQRDGHISFRDLYALRQAFGAQTGAADYDPAADLNQDGSIDLLDLSLLSKNYGLYGARLQETDPEQPADPPTPTARLWVAPAQISTSLGQRVVAEVMLSTGGNAAQGVELWLEFDPQDVTLESVETTGALPDLLPGNALNQEQGYMHYVARSVSAPVSGTLSLLRLTFLPRRATSAAGTPLRFSREAGRPNRVAAGGCDLLERTAGATLVIHAEQKAYLPVILATHGAAGGAPARAALNPYEGARALPIVGRFPVSIPTTTYQDEGARDVRLRGTEAYLLVAPYNYAAPNTPYVYRLDISQPTAPRLVGAAEGIARDPDEIWLVGDLALVAKKGNGVDLLDLAHPPSLAVLGNFLWCDPLAPIAKGLHAVGERLYIADERYGLQVVDISDPRSPRLLGAAGAGSSFGEGVWCEGTVVYFAASSGLHIFDVSKPQNPTRLADPAVQPPGRVVDVQVEDGRLYVAAEHGGVTVYDLSDPRRPVYLGSFTTHFAQKIDVVGRTVFVADDAGGLVVLDANDPAHMRAVGYCDTPGRAFGVSAAGGYAYVADGREGLQVVSLAALTPTPTPSPTPTATATPTPTATPTCTPTPTRRALALPLILR